VWDLSTGPLSQLLVSSAFSAFFFCCLQHFILSTSFFAIIATRADTLHVETVARNAVRNFSKKEVAISSFAAIDKCLG
jgi:hypothetical protein